MVERYRAEGMRLVGGYREGEFRIGLGPTDDQDASKLELLGSGPSLVDALDDALQNAILVEEDWRKATGKG